MQELGFHYRITDIQASLAVSQIKELSHLLIKDLKFIVITPSFFNIKGIEN